jgi:Dot/Icm secretion system protein (dot_icm_IcmQ)
MSDKEMKEKIQKLVLDSIEADKKLRDQYQVGDKFRFIRDRLMALQARVEEELQSAIEAKSKKLEKIEEGEVLVYVHIYNAQGIVFSTWQKMLSPSVFYEYSVNRPIYTNKADIEAFIRSRPNKVQHGFITIAVQAANILPAAPDAAKDTIGSPLIKIKEGCLLFNKMISFTHQNIEYVVDETGQVIKKEVF